MKFTKFIFSIWSFVSEYVVVRWQQGKNGKEAREDTVFAHSFFELHLILETFGALHTYSHEGEGDYHALIDKNSSLYIVLYLSFNWSCANFLYNRHDKYDIILNFYGSFKQSLEGGYGAEPQQGHKKNYASLASCAVI